MSKAFAAVNTLPKSDKKHINPRATRYGMLPIWSMATSARDFYVWRIPANQVFPFRPFIGEIGQDVNGNQTYVNERMPQDQILDMYNSSQFFLELEPLARLNDEARAQTVVDVLANPTICDRYPLELGHECATCWYMDSVTRMDDRIKALEDAELRKVARECAALLRAGLQKAIEEARRQLDVAIRDIDDPKSGKAMFYDHDYKNVYHTHSDRPTYKTSTSNTDVGAQIASAIQNLANKSNEPSAPAVDLAKLVTDAVAEATRDLREKLAKYEQAEPEIKEPEAPAPKKSK